MKQRKITKAGWQLCIQLIDESTDWVALKNIKRSYPVQLAYYVKRVKIDDKPVFAWWVSYVQKNIDPNIGNEHTSMEYGYQIR